MAGTVTSGVPVTSTKPGAYVVDRIDPACPSAVFPFQVGGKWTGMIVVLLVDGPRRFTDLRDTLAGVTPKVLTETLRAMQRDGLVLRREFPANPPHVEYELTALGASLMELIDAARSWSDRHMPELLAARRANA
ncbi:transcriptional regulator [Paractinoplanes tereljensis]|uniref:Transcriptional regulator n=1 Tax=Paractinoplanes tereljensis TaxID=571912 RepID=A0A919TU09_9ACTN|nr:transcriptional regulator [Actinoplanes tereljensis]